MSPFSTNRAALALPQHYMFKRKRSKFAPVFKRVEALSSLQRWKTSPLAPVLVTLFSSVFLFRLGCLAVFVVVDKRNPALNMDLFLWTRKMIDRQTAPQNPFDWLSKNITEAVLFHFTEKNKSILILSSKNGTRLKIFGGNYLYSSQQTWHENSPFYMCV